MKLLLIILFFLLNGCSTITFNSNVDAYAKKQIRKSAVKRYTNFEIMELAASQIGYVEVNHCQLSLRAQKPNKAELISALKVKTQQLGANGLVFDSCSVNRTTGSCYTDTRCKGVAYLVQY